MKNVRRYRVLKLALSISLSTIEDSRKLRVETWREIVNYNN